MMIYPEKKKITKKEINDLPAIYFKGKIHLCDNEKKINAAAIKLNKEKIIGFDTETKPSFKKGEYFHPSLIQLATENDAYLFQLNKNQKIFKILKIFENSNIIKTGVAIERDVQDLNKIFTFKPKNFVELSTIAKNNDIENLGLRSLTALFFESKLSKKEQISNWAKNNLTESQIKYAATDAWISRKLYICFLELGLINKQ